MPRVEIYEARRGLALRKQWRFRIIAANGRIIAVSSEGYSNRDALVRGLAIVGEALDRSH